MLRLSRRSFLAALFVTPLPTPNPECRQFRCAQEDFLASDTTCDVPNFKLKNRHPLAAGLFEQYEREVRSVFVARKYVSVVKNANFSWDRLDRSIATYLGAWMFQNEPTDPIFDGALGVDDTAGLPTDSETMLCIKELLREQVRPMVQADGGDIKLVSFDPATGVLLLGMLGACASCPSSKNTLKDGIERMMQHWVPEVKSVEETKDRSLFRNDENALFRDKDDVVRTYNDFEEVRQDEIKKAMGRRHPVASTYQQLTEPSDEDDD